MALAGLRKKEEDELKDSVAGYAARYEDWLNGDVETIIPQWETVTQPEPEPEPEPTPQPEEQKPTVKPTVEPVLENIVEPEPQTPSAGYLPYGESPKPKREEPRKEEPEPLTPAQTYEEWARYVEAQDRAQEANDEMFAMSNQGVDESVLGNGYVQPVTPGAGTRRVLGEYPVGTMDYLRENDLPVDWLNTEDGQYWLEAQNQPQPEMLFPTDYGTTEIPGMPEPRTPITRDQFLTGVSDVFNPVMNLGVRPAVAESGIDPNTGRPYFDTFGEMLVDSLGYQPREDRAYDTFADMVTGETLGLERKPGTKGLTDLYRNIDNEIKDVAEGESLAELATTGLRYPLDVVNDNVLMPLLESLFDRSEPVSPDTPTWQDNLGWTEPRALSGNDPMAQYAEPEEVEGSSLNDKFKHFLGKAGQSVGNRFNENRDAVSWVMDQMDGMTFDTEQERYDYEDALFDQYEKGLEDGTIERKTPLITSPEVEEGIENVISDIGGGIGTALDWMSGNMENLGDAVNTPEYEEVAKEGIFTPGTPEFFEEVNRRAEENDAQRAEQERLEGLLEEERRQKREKQSEAWRNQLQSYINLMNQMVQEEQRKRNDEYRAGIENAYQTYLSEGYRNDAARLMAQHPELAGKIDKNGNYIGDSTTPLEDALQAPPVLNPDGTPNTTLQDILDNGWTIDPALLGNAEGTAEYEAIRKGNAERILHEYDNPNGGFSNVVIPDEIANFISSGQWGANINLDETGVDALGRLFDTSNPNNVEAVNATAEQFEAAYKVFVDANPHIKLMLENGVITPEDVVGHFFKGLNTKGGKKSGSGSGYGSGRYYGGGGGGGYYGGGSRYQDNNPNLTPKQQREQRVNNIMKNWSF